MTMAVMNSGGAVHSVGVANDYPAAAPAAVWHVFGAMRGREQAAADNLIARMRNRGFSDVVLDAVSPTREIAESRNGKLVVSNQRIMPGYIAVLIAMPLPGESIEHDDAAWQNVVWNCSQTNFVGQYIGPMTETEAENMWQLMNADAAPAAPQFKVGQRVEIWAGSLAGMVGVVQKADHPTHATVTVTMFGRETAANVEYKDLKAHG